MKRLKLVVSDFHVNKGRRLPDGSLNLLEDFTQDHRFQEFLEFYLADAYADYEVELIFNGDMLNLIQVDYHGHYPVVLTENVSVDKIRAVIAGHPVFFDSLRTFLAKSGNSLTYVVGNHDQEMLWKGCRQLFEDRVGKPVNWRNIYYLVDGVHIEHGHQYEAVNRVDTNRLFLTENLPEPILNLPWGTLFTVQYITKLKAVRPAVDKVRPFRMVIWWSLMHDTWMALASLLRLSLYFLGTRFSRTRYRQSSLKNTLAILREASVFPDLTDAARKILRTAEIHTVIFGHTHVYKQVQLAPGKQYINTGTWNDIISLELESFARRTRLTYVRIDYSHGSDGTTEMSALPTLRHWIGKIPLEDDALSN